MMIFMEKELISTAMGIFLKEFFALEREKGKANFMEPMEEFKLVIGLMMYFKFDLWFIILNKIYL